MTNWVVIPVKAPRLCKTRLAGVLDDRERRDLTARMLRRVAFASGEVVGRQNVRLLGPSRHDLPDSFALLDDSGTNLNASLVCARDAALAEGIERLTFVSADLPMIEPDDVAELIDNPANSVAISSDRWGAGTNALSLPLPQAATFAFRYGENSFSLHGQEVARLGLRLIEVRRRGLQVDIDEPEDLAFYKQSGLQSRSDQQES